MKPLEGVTILDFTQALSGPFCVLNLADYGARVIKVERLGVGDQSRDWGPMDKNGVSTFYPLYNRNKESISVDMRSPEGAEIIKKIASSADIAVNNFKVGTLEKMGLSYDNLKEINPDIIFTSLSGYGQEGPMAKLPAYDNVIEATSGLMNQSGMIDNQPIRSGSSVGDSYTGLMTAFCTLAAYYHKLETGEGQAVDVAMQDTLFSSIEDSILESFATGYERPRQGNQKSHLYAPYDVYKCKDGWCAVAAITDRGFEELCKEANRQELLKDERFTNNSLRCENVEALTDIMKDIFKGMTFEEIINTFSCRYASVSPVYHAGQMLSQKQIHDREMIMRIDDNNIGEFNMVGFPVKLEKTPAEVRKPSSKLGQETRAILKEFGYSDDHIDELIAKGVVETSE